MADVSKKEARRRLAAKVAADRQAAAQAQEGQVYPPGVSTPFPGSAGSIAIVTPASNDAAILARQEEVARAQAQAEASRAIPGGDMLKPVAVAGFELAAVFAEWMRRRADGDITSTTPLTLQFLRPNRAAGETEGRWESVEEFGDRIARGILALLKEV